MRVTLAVVSLFLSFSAGAAEVARVGPYTFHSAFWINLHETLMHFATARKAPDLSALTAEEKVSWDAAVQTYRKVNTGGSITFEPAMRITHDVLTRIPDDATSPDVRPPLGEALEQAAPIYRRHFWSADDRANRFWIGYASAMLRDAGDDLARGHERVYGTPWPKAVRVDAAAYAVPFGAYTMMGMIAGVHATISSRSIGNAGLAAAEVVVHETSHSLVGPNHGPVAEAIKRHADRLGIDPPPDLWHAILFATSSEVARLVMRDRGIADYKPFVYTATLYERVWPRYREPIEKYWLPYVNGKGTLDEAIGKIVEAAPKPR